MIRSSELQGKRVRRENGENLGRVYEIRVRDSRVTALICGFRGFLQRLTGSVSGHRVEWPNVIRITPSEIVVADRGARTLRRARKRRR
jgi:sporulation protein YlmC with PRC-barrel domain